MASEMKDRGCSLKTSRDLMTIISPSGFSNTVNIEISGNRELLYSTKLMDHLFTGSSPVELLSTVADKIGTPEKPSVEYENGFRDGVASVNKRYEETYDHGYKKGYKKAFGEAIAMLTNAARGDTDVRKNINGYPTIERALERRW